MLPGQRLGAHHKGSGMCRKGYAATPCLDATVTVHRVGVLDLSSLTDRTSPVIRNPFKTTLANSPRYEASDEALQQLRKIMGKATTSRLQRISNFACLHHVTNMVAVRNTFPR